MRQYEKGLTALSLLALVPLLSAAAAYEDSGSHPPIRSLPPREQAIIKSFPNSPVHPNGCYLHVYFERRSVVGPRQAYCEAVYACGHMTIPSFC